MESRLDLVSRIEELGQTTIEAIEHAAALVEEEDADALVTLPIMSEVLEAYNAIGDALPLTLEDREYDHTGDMVSVDAAFAVLVRAYEEKDSMGVRSAIQNEVLPLYKHWFDAVQVVLPHLQH